MDDTEEKIADLMLDTAWKSIGQHQQRIDRIDDKANNMMILSGVLITIISGIVVGLIDKLHISIQILLLTELILFSICIYYSFKTIQLKDFGVLDILKTMEKIEPDIVQSKADVAYTIGIRQLKFNKIGEDKQSCLIKSMKWFKLALTVMVFIVFWSIILFFLCYTCLTGYVSI